jgi:hypothetical protein
MVMAWFRRSSVCGLLGGFVVAASAGVVLGSGADTDWRKRFEAEAPTAWEEYRQANRYAQGVCRGESQGSRSESEIKANETCRSVRTTDMETGSSEVFAQNPQYTFQLKAAKGRAWMLVSFYRAGQPDDKWAEDIRRRIDQYTAQVEQAVRLEPDAKLLVDLIRSPRTRITTVTPRGGGGAELVEVRFDVTPDPADERKLVGGTLLLDPARGWLPLAQSASVRNQAGTGAHTSELEFKPGLHPQLRRVVWRMEYTLSNQAEPWRQAGTMEWDLRVPDRLPDTREFTLSAYGLPEPIGVKWERPTPRHAWFLLAAGVFTGLAVGFRWLARRQAARASP